MQKTPCSMSQFHLNLQILNAKVNASDSTRVKAVAS